jgi:hypothetical protein
MDAFDIAVFALRLALVLVLYAFLVAVLRVASQGLQSRERPRAPEAPTLRPVQRATPTRRPRAVPVPTANGHARLRVEVLEAAASGLAQGAVLELSDGATLGRSPVASVVVADPTVSSQHVQVQQGRGGSGWLVVDLGSTNGTLLNQQPIAGQAWVAPGDVIGLGNVRLRVAE